MGTGSGRIGQVVRLPHGVARLVRKRSFADIRRKVRDAAILPNRAPMNGEGRPLEWRHRSGRKALADPPWHQALVAHPHPSSRRNLPSIAANRQLSRIAAAVSPPMKPTHRPGAPSGVWKASHQASGKPMPQ